MDRSIMSKSPLISNLASIKFSNVTIVWQSNFLNIMKSTQNLPETLTGTDRLGANGEKILVVLNTILSAVITECITNGIIQTQENVVLERGFVNSTNHV